MKRALTIGFALACMAAVAGPGLRVFNWSAVGTNTVRTTGNNEVYKLLEIRGVGIYPASDTATSMVTVAHANGITTDLVGVFTNGSAVLAPSSLNYVGPLDSVKVQSGGVTSGVFRCVVEVGGD